MSSALLVHNNLMSQILPYVRNATDLIQLYEASPEVQKILNKMSRESFASLLSLMQEKSTPFKSDLQLNGFIGTVDLTVTDIDNILTLNPNQIPHHAVRIEMNPGNWLTLDHLMDTVRYKLEDQNNNTFHLQRILLIGFNDQKLVILCRGFMSDLNESSYFAIEIDRNMYEFYNETDEDRGESNLWLILNLNEVDPPFEIPLLELARLRADDLQIDLESLWYYHYKEMCPVLEEYKTRYRDQNMQWAMGWQCSLVPPHESNRIDFNRRIGSFELRF